MAAARKEADARKEALLLVLKREVKCLMEEAAGGSVVHEESSGVMSLCAAVESCLADGVRGRVLGLFGGGGSSTTALLAKVVRWCGSRQRRWCRAGGLR